MKIFSAEQIRALDTKTIASEPIASIDLMERASRVFCDWFRDMFPQAQYISLICGKGNNGGDGLAIARILAQDGLDCSVFIADFGGSESADFAVNLERLNTTKIPVEYLKEAEDLPIFEADEFIIDALLGTGLTRPLEGQWAQLVALINEQENTTLSVDIPSGMFADEHTEGISIQANYVFSFEAPKLGFFFPENARRVGDFTFGPIGLDESMKDSLLSQDFFVTHEVVQHFYRKRNKFGHKGNYGHALLVAGAYGKMGAAILAARACLRSGAGLVTVHVPKCGYEIMQIALPEAMVSIDEDQQVFTRIYDLQKYATMGIGCGLSTKNKTRNAFCYILKNTEQPIVLDADALNILGQNPDWFEFVPTDSILTPHPKEFERLFGSTNNDFERNALQRDMAQKLGIYIILKGANTCIATPTGACYYNSTGNPGMGTAGSGDVLTGVLTALLAQGYSPFEASLLGVYIHGLAGDLVAQDRGQDSLIAGDLIEFLGKAYLSLH